MLMPSLFIRPPTEVLTPDEKDLIWRFRFYLCRDKQALTKFLRCVDWSDQAEAKQAAELMERWDPIDVDDALELLGPSFTASAVRGYAVSRLEFAADEDLVLYLLQLVQAVKSEPAPTTAAGGAAAAAPPAEAGAAVVEEAAAAGAAALDEDAVLDGGAAVAPLTFAPSSLAGFLIRRALLNETLGNYFFWCVDRKKRCF